VLRVLAPDQVGTIERPRVLLVLPAYPGRSVRDRDGLAEVARLDLHSRYGLVAVAPSFSNWPWYGDHPADPALRNETYLLQDVLPRVAERFPAASRTLLLLGFSKSGNGALSLLLRHPQRFLAAAIWDAPLMKTAPDQWEMLSIYGTPEHFQRYCVPRLLEERASLLRGRPPRLALLGHGYFGGPNPRYGHHLEDAHALMERLGIPHLYDNATAREHRWDSGWVEGAVAALDSLSLRYVGGPRVAEGRRG
jgi:hypothetical protein